MYPKMSDIHVRTIEGIPYTGDLFTLPRVWHSSQLCYLKFQRLLTINSHGTFVHAPLYFRAHTEEQ